MRVAGHNVSLGAESEYRRAAGDRDGESLHGYKRRIVALFRLRAIRTYVNLYFHVVNDEAVKILGNSEERDMCCFPLIMRENDSTVIKIDRYNVLFRVLEHMHRGL